MTATRSATARLRTKTGGGILGPLLILALGACQEKPPVVAVSEAPAPTSAPQEAVAGQPPAPKPITEFAILPFDDAVLTAADELFAKAASATGENVALPRPLAIDPLVDGVTAVQSVATRSMRAKIVRLIDDKYKQFDIRPFTTTTIAQSPLVLIGTLTAIDKDGQPSPARDSYRIWLTLMDLRSGKIVAKARARTRPDTVDAAPTPQFRDSPAWAEDPASWGVHRHLSQGQSRRANTAGVSRSHTRGSAG